MSEHDDIEQVVEQLGMLAPQRTPAARQALARFHEQKIQPERRFFLMNKKFAAVTTLFALFIVAFLTIPSTRAIASDILGLFRVQKFAPISISPDQLALLAELGEDGLYPGELEMLTEPEPAVVVASIDELYATLEDAEYPMWGVRGLDGLDDPDTILIESGGEAQLTVNLDNARQILSSVDVDPLTLPDSLDGADITIETNDMIVQEWENVAFVQTASPTINYPEDVDPSVIGEALLRLLGMADDEAYRLANNIDWTNTLLLPVPTEFATFSEVPVGNTTGIALEAVDGSGASIMWQGSGMVYMVTGEMTVEALLDVID